MTRVKYRAFRNGHIAPNDPQPIKAQRVMTKFTLREVSENVHRLFMVFLLFDETLTDDKIE